MSYAELVAESLVDEEEVYRLVGSRAMVPELMPAKMSPRLEDWKTENFQYKGEVIIPKVVAFDLVGRSPHCVAWVRRVGIAEPEMVEYDYFQIACDCLPAAEEADNPGSIFGCNALMRALHARSVEVDQAFRNTDTLVHHTHFDPRTHELWLSESGKQQLAGYILKLLDHTSQHPDIWIGNYLAGRHDINLLAIATGQEPATINRTAEMLEALGSLEFESETSITLTRSYKDFVDEIGIG